IRADLGTATNRNAVHGSDSPETAQREIACLFSSEEIRTLGGTLGVRGG
ncbi:MAG: nucleoside-diphosphate kinase, partial [Gammaproteobacteria bacterium]